MQFLAYALAYPFIWLISILPFRILYFLSDITYIIVYRIIGYRKKVVRENLALTLRHLDEKQRREVERKFYHHFCDSFFEMVKTLTISEEELKKRFVFDNMELVHEYEAKGKSVAVIIAHYGSYEWLLVMNKFFKTHKGYGIYKKIGNKYFDRLVRRIREKFNAGLIDVRQTVTFMRERQREGILGYYGFISDQSPMLSKAIYWTNFFGMEVPVHVGAEMLAKKLDMNVMFVKGGKIKRGYYKATFVPFEGDVRKTPNFQITDQFIKMLEKQIIECPEYYLWSHKRFKHRRNDPS